MMEVSKRTAELVSHLGTGKRNVTRRDALVEKMGLSDRAVREAVSLARLEGACICNDQDGKGYYIGEDRAELERQYKQTINRGRKIFAALKALRREMGKDENQLSIFNDIVEG